MDLLYCIGLRGQNGKNKDIIFHLDWYEIGDVKMEKSEKLLNKLFPDGRRSCETHTFHTIERYGDLRAEEVAEQIIRTVSLLSVKKLNSKSDLYQIMGSTIDNLRKQYLEDKTKGP